MSKPVCAIVGVGEGNGAAFARCFADKGYAIALLSRSNKLIDQLARELETAKAYQCDATDVVAMNKVFAQIEQDYGAVEVLIYNTGAGASGTVEQITPDVFEANWRVNNLGLLAAAQAVIPGMKQKACGQIIITTATASRRAKATTASFAAAKTAQRALAESMAKHCWPLGIHVAMVVIDGMVDLPRTRKNIPDKPDDFFVQPAAVAQTAYWLTQQSSSAWSFEVEARPFKEVW